MSEQTRPIVFLNVKDTMRKLGVKITKFYAIRKDPRFPKPISERPVRFVEHEVEAYQRLLMEHRDD